MKLFPKLFAVATATMISFAAFAEGGTKTAVLDTGSGGIKVSFSVSDNMEGPFDFARNKGPKVASSNGLTVGEVAWGARSDVGGSLIYMAGVMRRTQIRSGDQAITPEHLAKVMLEQNGFTLDRATVVPNGPKVNLEGMLPAITYKAIGDSIFEGPSKSKKVVYVMAVASADQKQGYAIAAYVDERGKAAFDADTAKYDKAAKGGFVLFFKGHKVDFN